MNQTRRSFLKTFAIGVGALMVPKALVFGPEPKKHTGNPYRDIQIDYTTKEIQISSDNDGSYSVDELYQFCKKEWLTSPVPMHNVTDNMFTLTDGWEIAQGSERALRGGSIQSDTSHIVDIVNLGPIV